MGRRLTPDALRSLSEGAPPSTGTTRRSREFVTGAACRCLPGAALGPGRRHRTLSNSSVSSFTLFSSSIFCVANLLHLLDDEIQLLAAALANLLHGCVPCRIRAALDLLSQVIHETLLLRPALPLAP